MSRDEMRRRRTQLQLSQSEIARRAGVSRYKLHVYEAGGSLLRPDEIARITDALREHANQMRQRLIAAGV